MGDGAVAAEPSALSLSTFSSVYDEEVLHLRTVESETHVQPASQQHILAERAHTSFHHDRRLQCGRIAPIRTEARPLSAPHSPLPLMDSPSLLVLPESSLTYNEEAASLSLPLDGSDGGNCVSAHPTAWTYSSRSVMGATRPQPLLPSAASTMSTATPRGDAAGVAYQSLIAEDDEGDVEYKWRLTDISATRFQHLVTQMQFRVSEGHGQCLYELGVSDDGTPSGLMRRDFNESVQTIYRMAAQLQLEATLLQCFVVGKTATDTTGGRAASPYNKVNATAAEGAERYGNQDVRWDSTKNEEELLCGEIMLSRRQAGSGGHDLSLAFCGAVGSGKSTLMAVLLTSRLDDGCGGTRQSLFNHKHELDTGRTSSLASRVWTVLQEPTGPSPALARPVSATQLPSPRDSPAAVPSSSVASCSCVSSPAAALPSPTPPFTRASPRSITLLDAGGDITKTMLFGLMSRKPDYVCVCVAADTADVSDVSLYAEVCCAMNTPFVVVVTKSDLVEEFELDGLVMEVAVALDVVGCASDQVDSMLMASAYCRDWLPRHRDAAVEGGVGTTTPVETPAATAGPLSAERLRVPVFCVSSVQGGEGLELFRYCLSHLQNPPPSPLLSPPSWTSKPPFEVLLDSAFAVDGVGHVVHGRVVRGPVEVGCSCYIGPGSNGRFYAVLVRGIHVDGEHVNEAQVGDEATFALNRLPEAVTVSHKGKVLVRQPETAVRHFQATVSVLSQSIGAHMEPIMYTRNARQAVRVTSVTLPSSEEESDATTNAGHRERFLLQCRFLFRPEVVSAGDAVVLHWAPRGIAVGRITSVMTPVTV
ncbi:conserved hypothetical protein [Leishmania braziliensis MHOM/BR/75/M2904]|uniref:Tr-type G domain-containing protein n=2 Tax=Leishmania braziliensis TaxID=5660 RepID=A4HAV7_LEIBR|nr:conserved hypothetical protein [Leishmania braziliensis MHOM/BR/75/M2904]CAJ2471417.1 unnamed protein product [Leishmania braziliensis]CAM38542.2 conserved hypothetical protein [Leishmania braziliensis MHOM/BR/75/M2904]SYZ65238.1 Elongation_factor_Tu_GTP_binding_domain_containing_protein [Leishmania braziliensis MHOM/BR/75/M2904]